MNSIIGILFFIFEVVLIGKYGWIAMLWSSIGFVAGLFISANIVLPILMGIPIAMSIVSKKEMKPKVFLALLRAPFFWTTLIFLLVYFFQSGYNWILDNETLFIGLIAGIIAILLSPLSKKSRDGFKSDFDKSYGSYYTIERITDKNYLALLFYKAGFESLDKNNFSDAIDNFSKAIDILKDLQKNHENEMLMRELFYNRGHCKDELRNYAGAISDYNLAIEYGGENINESEFLNRALAKFELGYYEDAIIDYNHVIEINPLNAKAFLGRGNAKFKNKDKDGACNDWKKSEKLGLTYATKFIENYCVT